MVALWEAEMPRPATNAEVAVTKPTTTKEPSRIPRKGINETAGR
jgi:hypothetical protein